MWPNLQETANLVTFTEEIVNGTSFFVQRVMSSLSSIVQLAEVYSEHCQTFQSIFAFSYYLAINSFRKRSISDVFQSSEHASDLFQFHICTITAVCYIFWPSQVLRGLITHSYVVFFYSKIVKDIRFQVDC